MAEYVVRLPNLQSTFDWLERNIDSWHIDNESADYVWINFETSVDATYAKEVLGE